MHALRAASCFDGHEFLLGGATVVVEGAHIVGVESWGAELPADVPVTTYDGTLLPGLVDTHVHLVSDSSLGGLERAGTLPAEELEQVVARSLAEQVAAGVTTVRDLGDCGFVTVAVRDRREAGVPRVVAAGPPVTVEAGHCHYLGGAVQGSDDIRRAIRERVERGVDLVKVMGTGGMVTPGTDINAVQLSAEELRLVVDLAHDAGLRVTTHAHGLAGQWHALGAGSDGIEHFSCLTPDGVECPDELLEAVARAGVTVCPTLGMRLDRVPPMELAPPALRDLVERLGLTTERIREERALQLARAREHGVRIVSGLDAGAGPPKPHGYLWDAVLWLLDTGMPVSEALASATSVAAEDCGLGGVTGVLAPGCAADLLVVDGDLAAEPAALERVVSVHVRGEEVGLARQ